MCPEAPLNRHASGRRGREAASAGFAALSSARKASEECHSFFNGRRDRSVMTAGSSSIANITARFKSMWAGDEQADAALEWISRDPSLRRTLEVPGASFYRVLDVLAAA